MPNSVKFLFMLDWYDGPLEALVVYKDRIHLCRIIDIKEDYTREFGIYHLSDELITEFLVRKKLFEKYIGNHWSYDIDNDDQHEQSEWSKYYMNVGEPPNTNDLHLVAEVEWPFDSASYLSVEEYLELPYHVEISQTISSDDEMTFTAHIVEFENLFIEANTLNGLKYELFNQARLWIIERMENHLPIPQPYETLPT